MKKNTFLRILLIAFLAILEIGLLLFLFVRFSEKAVWMETVLRILSVLVMLNIVNNSRHLSQDMIWILLIALTPIIGTALYLFVGADLLTDGIFRQAIRESEQAKRYYVQDEEVRRELGKEAPDMKGQFRYISDSAGYPVYRNSSFDYYPLGEDAFPIIKNELEQAKHFIFLEYFIIEEGEMWNEILKILKRKASEGVEVRVLYDDVGSLMTLSWDYAEKLEEKGIKCVSFNRIHPILKTVLNHRDHRKILVIDGVTAFSGGINLADEYINRKERFGHWKDNAFRVRGEAVWSYAVLFLTNWNSVRKEDEEYRIYYRKSGEPASDGYIAPYGDTPFDNEITGQNIYMNILNQANDYVYIMTPYLIIDTEFINALLLAAKRGVDVRIITPGIPDKKLVYQVTRSFYPQLIEGGVHIVEYTPGFVHGKVFVSDDKVATVGTINLDYRSLYLHFENGTYLYKTSSIAKIREDMEDTMKKGRFVSLQETKQSLLKRLFVGAIKLFASQL